MSQIGAGGGLKERERCDGVGQCVKAGGVREREKISIKCIVYTSGIRESGRGIKQEGERGQL